jgi:putative intracellular protease/amidase
MKLTVVIFDGLTTLDAVGGYEVLSRIPGMEVEFAAPERGIIVSDTRALGLVAWKNLRDVESTDILYVPGGPGGAQLETDEVFLAELRRLDATSTWTFGVCNGSALLACAGFLEGRKATSNWFYRDRMKEWGAEFVAERYQRDGKYVTSAGVSAGIDGALYLASLIAGEEIAKTIQLGVEYYPNPPFPERTPAEAPEMATQIVREFDESTGVLMLDVPPAFGGSFEVVRRAETRLAQAS